MGKKGIRKSHHRIIELPTDKPCLNIRVSKASLDRALILMNTILFALEANGFEVKMEQASTTAQIFGQDITFGIAEDLSIKERREETHSYGTQEVIVYGASGNLVFQIFAWAEGCRKRWADGKIQRVEKMLPQCLGGLMRVARAVRIGSDEIKRRELERERREKERAELARQIKEEETRLSDLETMTANWIKAKQIRAFVRAFEKTCTADGVLTMPDSSDIQWMAWARQQADRFDPLVESAPSVLDRKSESRGYCD